MSHGRIRNCYSWNVQTELADPAHLKTLLGTYVANPQGDGFARQGHTDCAVMSIHLARFDQNWPEDNQPPHDEDEFYYVLSGEADMQVDEAKFHIQAGDLIFVPRHTFHKFSNYLAMDLLVVFSPDYSGRGVPQPPAPPVSQTAYEFHFKNMPGALKALPAKDGKPMRRQTLLGTADLNALTPPIRTRESRYQTMSVHLVNLVEPDLDLQIPHWEDEVYLILDVTPAEGKKPAIIMGDIPTRVTIQTGDLVFVPRFTFHRFEDYSNLLLLIFFTPDYSVKTNMEVVD